MLGHPHSTDWQSEAQKACTELSAGLVPETVLWAISLCSASWGQEEEAKGAPAVVGEGHLGTQGAEGGCSGPRRQEGG